MRTYRDSYSVWLPVDFKPIEILCEVDGAGEGAKRFGVVAAVLVAAALQGACPVGITGGTRSGRAGTMDG